MLTSAGWTNPSSWEAVAADVLAIFLAAAGVCLVVRVSRAWREPLVLRDSGWPSLRTLAWVSPTAVAAQVVLGAAYRHELAGVMAHVSWAFAAAIVVLTTAIIVLTNSQVQGLLRHVAIGLTALTGVQLMLGVGAYMARVAAEDGAPPLRWLATLHAAVGGLVLALAAAMGLLLRHARLQPEEQAA
jgi:hypothetical protein